MVLRRRRLVRGFLAVKNGQNESRRSSETFVLFREFFRIFALKFIDTVLTRNKDVYLQFFRAFLKSTPTPLKNKLLLPYSD